MVATSIMPTPSARQSNNSISLTDLPVELLAIILSFAMRFNRKHRRKWSILIPSIDLTAPGARGIDDFARSLASVAASKHLFAVAEEAYFSRTEFSYTISIEQDYPVLDLYVGTLLNFEPAFETLRYGTFDEHEVFFKGVQKLRLYLRLDDPESLRDLLQLAIQLITRCERLNRLTVDLADMPTAVSALVVKVELEKGFRALQSSKPRCILAFGMSKCGYGAMLGCRFSTTRSRKGVMVMVAGRT